MTWRRAARIASEFVILAGYFSLMWLGFVCLIAEIQR
jgi:hypothetical protein